MSRTLISEETKQRVQELWNKGMSGGEIGKELGITKNSVIGIIDRLRRKGFFVRVRGEGTFKVKKPRPLVKKPVKKVPSEIGTPTDILGLTYRSCRFIVEDGTAVTTRYCNSRVHDKSFCKHHYDLCYVQVKPKKQHLNAY